MKKFFFWVLALALLLASAPASSAPEAVSPGPVSLTELVSSLEDAWRLAVHALRVEQEEENALPKVIDRINNPGAEPGFSFSGEDDLLEIWFPAIRDQDAAIFLYQDQVWMLDCGDWRASSEIVPLLRYLGITKIDRIINTHPHHDHLNGLSWIDAQVPVSELLICFPEDSTKHMAAAMEYCKGNGIRVTTFGDESILSMGDGLVSFLAWMKSGEEESMNDRSAQFMISYGSCSMLSMADMELRGQRQLLEALGTEPLAADILRYPHHGKRAMLNEMFYAVNPALTIITNSPRIAEITESTKYLGYKHAAVAYTNRQDRVIHLVTDGRVWLCEDVPFNPGPWLTDPAKASPVPSVSPEASTSPEASPSPKSSPSPEASPSPKSSPRSPKAPSASPMPSATPAPAGSAPDS